MLTPLSVDPGHPFPYISNLSLNLIVRVGDPVTGVERVARVKVPPLLPRFVVMPDGERFVALEQIIAAQLATLFPDMVIGEHYAFRVTRNADLVLDEDEADDLLAAVEMELRRRRFGRAVRLEVAADISDDMRDMLVHELDLGADDSLRHRRPARPRDLWGVYELDRPDLHEEAWAPMTPPRLANAGNEPADLFAVLRERDVLVHHPYDSFATSVEALHRPGGRRPRRARHQADAVPDLGRQPHRARRSSRRPKRASRWRRWSSSRRASTSRPTSPGPVPSKKRACTWCTGSSA